MDNREEDLAKKEELLREREEALQKREEQLKYIDYLIAACGVAIVVCVILGMMKGRGIF